MRCKVWDDNIPSEATMASSYHHRRIDVGIGNSISISGSRAEPTNGCKLSYKQKCICKTTRKENGKEIREVGTVRTMYNTGDLVIIKKYKPMLLLSSDQKQQQGIVKRIS